MKKITVVPDSFKGTLTQREFCDRARRAAADVFGGGVTVDCIPVADGGEGSVDCFLAALGGERVGVGCRGVFGEATRAEYGILPDSLPDGTPDGATAVIEVASCAGLTLAGERRNPCVTTSYGVGEQIADAVSRGCRRIILCLGGSATNDAGCGMAAALGYRFYDGGGRSFVPTGGTLRDIARIEDGRSREVRGLAMTVMCDVDNPMYGERGAAYVFAPQKGADAAAVALLDGGLRHVCGLMRGLPGVPDELDRLPGGGAAGGMGAGAVAFFGARLRRGIDVMLDTVDFNRRIADTDLIITGEGCLDLQSLGGKVMSGVARRASQRTSQHAAPAPGDSVPLNSTPADSTPRVSVPAESAPRTSAPVIAVVGGAARECGIDDIRRAGIRAVFTVNRLPEPLSESAPHTADNLYFTLYNIFSLIK